MHIRMLNTTPGSIDGIRVKSYDEGQEYDLTGTAGARELAESFVGAGLAEEVNAPKSASADAAEELPAAPVKAGRAAKK